MSRPPNPSARYLQAVNHLLRWLSPRGMRASAIVFLAVGIVAGVGFWVGLVAWIVARASTYLVDSIAGFGGALVCALTGNTLWQAAKLRARS